MKKYSDIIISAGQTIQYFQASCRQLNWLAGCPIISELSKTLPSQTIDCHHYLWASQAKLINLISAYKWARLKAWLVGPIEEERERGGGRRVSVSANNVCHSRKLVHGRWPIGCLCGWATSLGRSHDQYGQLIVCQPLVSSRPSNEPKIWWFYSPLTSLWF